MIHTTQVNKNLCTTDELRNNLYLTNESQSASPTVTFTNGCYRLDNFEHIIS